LQIAQLELAALGVDLELDPLHQMARDHVLEMRPRIDHDRPVVVVVLALLLHRAQLRRTERHDAERAVDALEHVDPARGRRVRHLQALAQRVDRQRAAHAIGQALRQPLELAQVRDRLQRRDLREHEPLAVGQRAAACEPLAARQERLGEPAECQQRRHGVGMAAEFGDAERVQPQVEVAPPAANHRRNGTFNTS
jgi:hypothetical protein